MKDLIDRLRYDVGSRPGGICEEAANEIKRLRDMADALLNHCDKENGECSECGRICCPEHDPMHFHHDGCPSCCAPTSGAKE